MTQYLLSTFAVEDEVEGGPGTPEEVQEFMVFGGQLQSPDASTVLRTVILMSS
jgi:hypothetical protein